MINLRHAEYSVTLIKTYVILRKFKERLLSENPSDRKKLYTSHILVENLGTLINTPVDLHSEKSQELFAKEIAHKFTTDLTFAQTEKINNTFSTVFEKLALKKLEERILIFSDASATKKEELKTDLHSVNNLLFTLSILESQIINYIIYLHKSKSDLFSINNEKFIVHKKYIPLCNLSKDLFGVIYAVMNSEMYNERSSLTKLLNLFIIKFDYILSIFKIPKQRNFYKRFYSKDLLIINNIQMSNKILTLSNKYMRTLPIN